jgi:hypothetical protein
MVPRDDGQARRALADEDGERGQQEGLSMKAHQGSLKRSARLEGASMATVELEALPRNHLVPSSSAACQREGPERRLYQLIVDAHER